MRFGAIEIDPARNPAILDTAAWDPKSAWDICSRLDEQYWRSAKYLAPHSGSRKAGSHTRGSPLNEHFIGYAGSCSRCQGSSFFLAPVGDGQQVFIRIGRDCSEPVLGEPIGKKRLADGRYVAAYKTDAATIDRYCRLIKPDKGPKALGATPRLGIGSRMSTCAWSGVWRAMHKCNFSANAIQNSVRELNLLDDILAGRPASTNHLPGFGTIQEGHTGSTFEGLCVAGVLDALKAEGKPVYGADADHIMVKRDAGGIIRAKRVIEAVRYYTFFTLDVSDILVYAAMSVTSAATAEAYLANRIPHSKQRKDVVVYHSSKRKLGGQIYYLDKATIGRLVGKYWLALEAVGQLYSYIKSVKNGAGFDLELSIDESPPEISPLESVTTENELLFLVLEMHRRQIPLTHVAPNFGIEKGLDYRGKDGLEGLEQRIRKLHQIASEYAVLLDFHSGDDLKSATRRVVGRATNGQNHFKISPVLQIIFAEALSDFDPEQFRFWWDDTLAYAQREAAAGSDFAATCIRQYHSSDNPAPSPHHAVFHYYNFATVGRRDANGQFIYREKFYTLPPDFYREYQRRVEYYLCEVARDVFNREP